MVPFVNSLMLTLRPASSDDEPFLRALIGEIVADDLGAHSWPEAMREPLVDIQYRARRQGLRATYPDGAERIVLLDNVPVGWVVTARLSDCLVLADIAILRTHRGRGFGAGLIRDLQSEAAGASLPLRLSVVRQNPARLLYERLGFAITGGDEIRYSMQWQANPDPQPPV